MPKLIGYINYKSTKYSRAKVYIVKNGNSIRIKNDRYLEILGVTDESCDVLSERLANIVGEIANVSQNIIQLSDNTVGYIVYGTFILDNSRDYFYESKYMPMNGFVMTIIQDPMPYCLPEYTIRFYVVQNYKKQRIFLIKKREHHILNREPIFLPINIKISSYTLNNIPINNRHLHELIVHILNNMGKNVVDVVDALADIYCEIISLIELVNTVPSRVKSAKKV